MLAAGEGPPGWPEFLAITPRAVHFSALEHGPATLLGGMRDCAAALLQLAGAGWRHRNVTPSNLMLALGGPGGGARLLLVGYSSAAPLGSDLVVTEEYRDCERDSQQEPPSLMSGLDVRPGGRHRLVPARRDGRRPAVEEHAEVHPALAMRHAPNPRQMKG